MYTNADSNEIMPVVKNNGNFLRKILKFVSPDMVMNLAAAGDQDETRLLFHNLDDARSEWMEAARNFDQVSEQDIVDYYIYRIKASQARYEYYLRKAKELHLKNKDA